MSLEDVVKRRLKKQQEEGQRDLVEKLNARIEELEKNPSKQEEQKSGLQIFQGGGFSGFDIGAKFRDGYQIGDVAKTGLDLAKAAGKTYAATVGDVWTSAARGLGGVSEGIGDALTYITAGIMDATDGTDKKGAADRLRKEIQKNVVGDLLTVDAIDKNSLLGSTSKAILEGVGQGVATQSAAGLGGPLLSGALMFVSGVGNNMTEAYQGGATDGEAAIYGLATGAWDAITETIAGGLGKGAKALGISKGIAGIDDKLATFLTKNIKNKVIANLIQGGVKAGGEGLEELLSYGGQVVAKKLTYLSEKDWAELWNNQEALENFVVGMMSSAIMQAPDVVKASQTGRDFVTGRTDAEQTVIDKVYKDRVAEQEKGGKKLTTKEKGQILDTVEQAYERGEIAVEDIEAALGGETYRKYTEATKQQEAMQAEFDKLNGMKKSDMTGAQEDRLQELRQQLEAMKTEDAAGKLQLQYQQEARAKAGGGQLMESYNQREQRRQAFQADLESYDAKQRAIVQKAIDSGILNNTRKSHEFVDLVAKIGAETGTDFDFTNSKKLRESGFALEGVTVNGFTDGKTVTVNINSAKALNTVVGHEIMHVLEGTELAGKLQEQLFAYAKTKGEFDKRRADLETLYAGRDADIDRELAADLVGDYLFTDIDFVRNLKAGNRNLFQRVFDEIKHLVKLATAGSKEARELEKVKKLFEDVYREAGTEKSTAKDGGVEYSVSQKNDTESQQFKRWFGDWQNHPGNASKIVNADGTPKVMYHGSPAQFSVFDKKKAKGSGIYGPGFSFTDSADQASVYGNRYSVYLDVKHPLQSGGEQVSRQQVRKFLEAVAENEDYSIENYGTYDVEQVLQTVMGSQKNADAFKIIQDINATAIGDMVEAAELFNSINGTAFDGIVVPTETVVFRPEQIKSATDNVGTFDRNNPDIRYSLSPEADRAYMDAVENANMDAAQVMVDEAAKQAGFTEEVYHGTRRGFGFTKYDPSKSNAAPALFTSGDLAVARTYSQDDGVTNISLAEELGLTAGNYRFFANTEGMIEIDAKGGVWDAIRLDQELQDKLNSGDGSNPYDRINNVTSTNELAKYAKQSGYRVVKITNVFDQSLQPGQEYQQEKPGSVYIFLYPNEQLRSADPVTYDDEGNVIPLSQRFNPQSGDFRESLSRAGETAGFDDSQIYGRDVALEAPVQKAPVAAQPESKATGMEAPTAAEMPGEKPVEAPVAEEKPVQTAQEEAKAAPAMEAPTAAEMPGEKPVEAPVAEEAKESAVETKAPKEGMEPVVSPKVYRPGEGKLKPKDEDMSQEEREYRDSMEDKPAETFRDVMEKRLQSLRREIEENRRNKQTVAEQYDEKIQSLKDEFVALKNKNTKHAQDILRSISRNQQLKEARMAEYDKRINDLTKRVQRTQERIDSDTGRADWAQGKLDKIDAKYEEELEALEARQKEQRRELEARTASKEQYFADRALELYDELSTLKKGIKASEDLAYFLDRGHTWNAIKSALLLVKDKPSGIANPHFGLEKIVRERLEQRYNDALAELADLDTQQAMDRKALEDAMKKEKATLQASQIKKTKMEQYQAESAELAGNTATWKDKKTGFGYSMQTMHRWLREVVRDENGNPDIARADAIYAYLQGTYNQNEAALKREAKKRKDQIRELGLNKYEDEYGAMLGELKYNPESQNDAELAYRAEEFLEAHKDKIDLEKTNKAIEMLRSEYDELIELLNNALREQGFREIPYRKGYFPHFMEPSQNFVQKLLNWKPKNNEIPTSIAGMTEEFNPQRSWQGFDKERKGNATVYSLQKGYNQYLDGALDWIYHIADIQRRRAFENHIREVHTDENARKRIEEIMDSDQYDAEDAQAQIESVLAEKKNPLNNLVVELRRGTNTLAGKKSSMDRSVEADFGRWVYSTMTNVANRSSANMVAGNLASAATNVIPIVQSWTQVKPRNSFKAVKQMIQAMNNDDGLVEKSAFLTNRLLQNESLYKDTWDKIGDVVSLPMEAVDKFTSQVVWRSKYIENIEKGMSEEAAIRDADQFAENVIAGRSRGNMPTIFDSKNPIYKVLTAFQLEVANQYGYFFKDVPTDTKAAMKGMTEKQKTEEKTKLAIGLTNMLLGTYVYNAAMEFITGNTPATDPIRILEGIIRDIWGEAEDDDEEETGEEIAHVAASALEELAKELPYIGGLLGGGRISSAAAIPYGDPFNMIKGTMEDFGEGDWANLKKEWLNLVYYGILPMGGGQIKKINEGIGMYLDPSEEFPFLPKIAKTPGSYTTSGNLRYAVEPTFWNEL